MKKTKTNYPGLRFENEKQAEKYIDEVLGDGKYYINEWYDENGKYFTIGLYPNN